ncbi:MAG: CoA transferase [Thermodesulfobacteriota bacterium]
MKKALAGITVIDLTTFMSGPFTTMALGDLGAEVIKIEVPGDGDASRHIPPYFHDGECCYYISLNRNKKSVTLNMNSKKGREILYGLVKKADIVMDNFRPGVKSKLGLDYETLKAAKPDIICCSITAFGNDGPYGQRPAYDLTIQAMSGAMSMTGTEDTGPLRMGVPMGDLASSLWALAGILSALLYREKTGEGQYVDLSLLDSLAALITYPALYYSYGGEVSGPLGSGHQAIVPFKAFKTKDYYLTVACANEKFWFLLCDAIGRPDLKDNPKFAKMGDRLKNRDELDAMLNEVFAQKTTAEWDEILTRAGAPCGPVNTIDKVFENPAIKERNMVISVDHFGEKLRFFGNPIQMSATPINEYKTPPKLGQDTSAVLAEYLGYSEEDIAKLRQDEVI